MLLLGDLLEPTTEVACTRESFQLQIVSFTDVVLLRLTSWLSVSCRSRSVWLRRALERPGVESFVTFAYWSLEASGTSRDATSHS